MAQKKFRDSLPQCGEFREKLTKGNLACHSLKILVFSAGGLNCQDAFSHISV